MAVNHRTDPATLPIDIQYGDRDTMDPVERLTKNPTRLGLHATHKKLAAELVKSVGLLLAGDIDIPDIGHHRDPLRWV